MCPICRHFRHFLLLLSEFGRSLLERLSVELDLVLRIERVCAILNGAWTADVILVQAILGDIGGCLAVGRVVDSGSFLDSEAPDGAMRADVSIGRNHQSRCSVRPWTCECHVRTLSHARRTRRSPRRRPVRRCIRCSLFGIGCTIVRSSHAFWLSSSGSKVWTDSYISR